MKINITIAAIMIVYTTYTARQSLIKIMNTGTVPMFMISIGTFPMLGLAMKNVNMRIIANRLLFNNRNIHNQAFPA